jgi:hypothetical protein
MATCAVIGQAVGTAAAIAIKNGLSPRGVYNGCIDELQQTLMDDDCWLPWKVRQIPVLSKHASLSASEGDAEPLRNGLDRPFHGADNGWYGKPGSWIQYSFDDRQKINGLRIIFDSCLNRNRSNMESCYPLDQKPQNTPDTLVKAFRIDILDTAGGWSTFFRETNNYQRLVKIDLGMEVRGLRLILESTWGAETVHVFSFEVN